jgi:cobalt-zinc-cadmium efflux system outer membrane protein
VQLSQLVELGGKRTGRRKLALLDRDLAAWDYEAARMDALTRATRAFIDVLAAQEMVALTAETTELVEQVQQGVGARVVAGVVSPIDSGVALAAHSESDKASRLLEAAVRGRQQGATDARFASAVGI